MSLNVQFTAYPRLQSLAIPAPIAPRQSYTQRSHGRSWDDPYFWLKDLEYPVVNDTEVLDYLHAENTYYQDFLQPHLAFVDKVFSEFKERPSGGRFVGAV